MSDLSFHITTFGCQMNVNDSAWLARSLTALGFTEAPYREARFHIMNTCSVRDKPEHKVYTELGHIRLLAEEFPERGIIACMGGCVAQQVGEKLFSRSKELRLIFGTDGIVHAPEAIAAIAENPSKKISLLNFADGYEEKNQRIEFAPFTPSAFVNIMQGCNNFCSYCIVPFVRGRQKSRHSSVILQECKDFLARGATELTLLGQNVNSFGQDEHGDGSSFVDLLYQVANLPGLKRLRFVTPHPKDMPPELIQAFAELPVLAPRLHLPLQSGSDRILKAMGRKYNVARYMSLVEGLKKARPDIKFSTDIIVGFPGETEADFEATMQAMRMAEFASSFSFIYSDRPGTRASKMSGKIPRKESLARLSHLQDWQNEHSEGILASMLGQTATVLLENKHPKGEMPTAERPHENWFGRDAYGFSVNVSVDPCTVQCGDMLDARIVGSGRNSLKAEYFKG